MANFPARVHVLLAREGATGLIIRRGPSKSVCTIGWNRKSDTFEIGQWLRGRIYERRCDLSPDGKYFLYFTMKGRASKVVDASFTAISLAPYVKAIGLWSNGSAWNGGGLFINNSEYWLNKYLYNHVMKWEPEELKESTEFPFAESYGGECPGVYYVRLQRDGWKLNFFDNKAANGEHAIFRKVLFEGWVIEKRAHATMNAPVGKGAYYDSHRLVHPERGITLAFPEWEWADLDRNRLVWVEAGALKTATLMKDGPDFEEVLCDFNEMAFKPIRAPY